MSSSNAVIPIILVLSFLSTIGVIYGALELSDDERNAWEVLKDLLSGKISLQDIWRVLSGRDAEAKAAGACQGVDQNGVYEYDKDGKCIKLGCKLGYYEQDNMCIERRNFSDEAFSGQTSVDCELDPDEPYTYGECQVKLNETCGPGAGTQLKNPNIISGVIGAGSCERATYVDCDIKCPDVCQVPDEHHTSLEGCKASTPGGEPVTLGEESGYCGEGTEVREVVPDQIPQSVLDEAGYTNIDDYLAYANPNGVCAPRLTSCKVECKDGLTHVGCDYGKRQYEYIKDVSGAAICFNKTQTEDYIVGDRANLPVKLNTILAADVRDADGTYDVEGNVSENNRKGLYIKYLSDQGVSYDNLSENKCTLFKTEECDAPREKVDCVIGDREVTDCISPGCGQQMYQSVTRGVTVQSFGDGDACPVDYTSVVIRTDPLTCGTSLKCCGDSDYKSSSACKNTGKMTYTLDSTNCDANGLPETKEVDCCYQSEWSRVDGYDGCELIGNKWKRKYTRTVTDGCEGDDEDTEKHQDDGDCCYENGDWVIDGACSQYEENKQRYRQTTTGVCPPGTDTKYEVCQNCILETSGLTKFTLGTRPLCSIAGCRDIPDCKRHKKYKIIQEHIGTGTVPVSTGGQCVEETVSSMVKQTCPEGYPLDVWYTTSGASVYQFS